jgi:tetratricopeptide (TPR) repeat protein
MVLRWEHPSLQSPHAAPRTAADDSQLTMHEVTGAPLLTRAREAAAHGDWPRAYELFVQADANELLNTPDLVLFASCAYAAGQVDATIDTWERVHAEGLRAGDHLMAAGAAVRVALHLLFDTALLAPIRGWATRAERLLDGQGDTPVHAWLAVVRSYERLLSGDFERAREWARRAVDVGSDHDPAAAALGRVAEARSVILGGEVARGLDLLNEAAVATVSGELDPLSTGVVYCEVVCALQAVAQYDLAEEWTQAMERWRHGQPVGSIHGRCRVHRAEILRLRGLCVEAEQEALAACDELRPYLRREFGWPLTELGRIRLRTGDVHGAEEAFLAAHQAGWDPQPGLALVRLAQGDVPAAAALIREALEFPLNVPSKELPPNSDLRRAPLLEAQVEIAIAAGDLDRARSAADELSHVATVFDSKALVAGAVLASGQVRLAAGDPAAARRDFEAAVHQWGEIGAPYETALGRMGLAHTHRAEGNEARAILEFRAAYAAFQRIGAASQAARAADAMGEMPRGEIRESPPQTRPTLISGPHSEAENVFRREGDYWSVIFDGHLVRVQDMKGIRYLARLLANPGRELHVVELVAVEEGGRAATTPVRGPGLSIRDAGDAGEMLDPRAKEAYQRRLTEIEDDLQEARAFGDTSRVAQATAERDCLARELSRAVGLGGRHRRVGSAAERARASVTRAVRHAMRRIRAHHPSLGTHLERAIRTGTYCAYLPDTRVPLTWEL